MNPHPFIMHFPKIFRLGTYLNVATGAYDTALVIFRFAITTFAIIYNAWSLVNDKDFAKLHDLLYFFMMISHQAMVIINKSDILALIRNLQEPLRIKVKGNEYLDVIKDCTNDISLYGSYMIFLLVLVIFWSLTPVLSLTNIVDPTTNQFFNLPLNWIPSSTPNTLAHSAASVISILALVLGNAFILNWYPPLLYSVSKIKLKIRILAIDMSNFNDRVELHARDDNDLITKSFSTFTCCSNCNKGKAVFTASGIYKSYVITNGKDEDTNTSEICEYTGAKNCCKRVLRRLILQESYKDLVKDAAVKHVEILQLVFLVDRCYRLSVMIYNQFGILFPLLLIPKISILASLSVTEILYGCTEIGGIFCSIFIINHLGQTILDESERLRQSLYQCRWEDAPVSVRRNLLVMQTMATRDLRLTAGTMYTLSMEAFKNIMKTAYSYASLLQTLDQQ